MKATLRQAAKHANRCMTDLRRDGRLPEEFMRASGFVPCIEDEPAVDVFARMTATPPPAILAIFEPERDSIQLVLMQRGERQRAVPDSNLTRVSPEISIGMLIHGAKQLAMPQQWEETFQATPLVTA